MQVFAWNLPLIQRMLQRLLFTSNFITCKEQGIIELGVKGWTLRESVCIWSYSGPYFPAFGLNKERYSVSLRIQAEWGKIRTRITAYTDTFYAVEIFKINRTASLCG